MRRPLPGYWLKCQGRDSRRGRKDFLAHPLFRAQHPAGSGERNPVTWVDTVTDHRGWEEDGVACF